MQNLGLKKNLFWDNLGARSKAWAPVISAAGNLQLSFRISFEIYSACLLENCNFILPRLLFFTRGTAEGGYVMFNSAFHPSRVGKSSTSLSGWG